MNNKMRKEFESWVSSTGSSVAREDALYRSQLVGWMWKAWQASREALVVELPDEEEHKGVHYGVDYMPTEEVCKAIEAAGVRVKQ